LGLSNVCRCKQHEQEEAPQDPQQHGEVLLCGLGPLVTLGTYFGIFDMRGYYLVACGPALGGGLMALAAFQHLKKG